MHGKDLVKRHILDTWIIAVRHIENFLDTLEKKKVSLQKHRFFLNFDEMS